MTYIWDESAWEDYTLWQVQDRRVARRINDLLKDIARGLRQHSPHEGIGKPEALKHGLHGYWSRRITDEHRLIYKVVESEIRIAACRYHHGN